MVEKVETVVSPKNTRTLVMAVTANFTAEPVGDALRFWMNRLGLQAARLEFSPYNQVFQELIAPDSLLASSEPGVNFLLVRLEEWARDKNPQTELTRFRRLLGNSPRHLKRLRNGRGVRRFCS